MKKHSLFPNKLMAAVILALALGWIAGSLSENLLEPKPLAKNAFVVDMSTLGAAVTSSASPTTAPQGPAPIAPLLAAANVENGQKYARVCGACHSFGKGEAAKIGPNLYGIIGAKHAHMDGFSYSEAMKALSDKLWTFDALNEFLFNPRGVVQGTKMSFAGIKNDSDRANVIAWLRTLSDNPVALPK